MSIVSQKEKKRDKDDKAAAAAEEEERRTIAFGNNFLKKCRDDALIIITDQMARKIYPRSAVSLPRLLRYVEATYLARTVGQD